MHENNGQMTKVRSFRICECIVQFFILENLRHICKLTFQPKSKHLRSPAHFLDEVTPEVAVAFAVDVDWFLIVLGCRALQRSGGTNSKTWRSIYCMTLSEVETNKAVNRALDPVLQILVLPLPKIKIE